MNELLHEVYPVEKGAFETAGEVSGTIKRMLRKLGVPSQVIRRVSVASYEVELNLVIHSLGGQMEITIEPESVTLDVADRGPGIPDLDLAMQEGWSTASEQVRRMGFGAGMGLPNIKKNSDVLSIETEKGQGTKVTMIIYIREDKNT